MENHLRYQYVIPIDKKTNVEVTLKVSELKYIYNLLVETPKDMLDYHSIAENLLQVLKDNEFDFNPHTPLT